MSSRIGRWTPAGDRAAFEEALTQTEAAVLSGQVAKDAVYPLLRKLEETRPFDITADLLIRLLRVCYRIMGLERPVEVVVDPADADGWARIGWACTALIESTFFDSRRESRHSIERSVDHARVLYPDRVGERVMYYRPRPQIPLDQDTARDLIDPYLRHLEVQSQTHPTDHLKLVWDVVTNPLPPFERLFWEWLDDRGEGDDLRLALSLDSLRRRGQQRMSWAAFENRLIPLLSHENVLIVAHAAAFIGSLWDEPTERLMGEGAWDALRMLTCITNLPKHRRTAAGAFLTGIDDLSPFAEFDRILPDFNVEDWVMDILEDRVDEPYLPGIQAFWFFLHEHFDRDPAMVSRMIDAGHLGVAWMCITENNPPADGMQLPLAQLAEGKDAGFAESARTLLNRLGSAT